MCRDVLTRSSSHQGSVVLLCRSSRSQQSSTQIKFQVRQQQCSRPCRIYHGFKLVLVIAQFMAGSSLFQFTLNSILCHCGNQKMIYLLTVKHFFTDTSIGAVVTIKKGTINVAYLSSQTVFHHKKLTYRWNDTDFETPVLRRNNVQTYKLVAISLKLDIIWKTCKFR